MTRIGITYHPYYGCSIVGVGVPVVPLIPPVSAACLQASTPGIKRIGASGIVDIYPWVGPEPGSAETHDRLQLKGRSIRWSGNGAEKDSSLLTPPA